MDWCGRPLQARIAGSLVLLLSFALRLLFQEAVLVLLMRLLLGAALLLGVPVLLLGVPLLLLGVLLLGVSLLLLVARKVQLLTRASAPRAQRIPRSRAQWRRGATPSWAPATSIR